MSAERTEKVSVELDRDLALSLFEWSYQFMTDRDPTFQHPADAIGIDQLSSELERALQEPFREEYGELLRAARGRALERYREQMEPQDSAWLEDLRYRTDL